MEKTSTSYILPFDGEVIATKLSLIEVDNTAAETKAEKVSIQAEKVSVQTDTKSTDDGLTLTTKSYTDSLVASGAAQALADAEVYADSLAINYDAVGAAAQALADAKSYTDSLAENYDAAGAATSALDSAKSYADSLAATKAPDNHMHSAQDLDTEGAVEGQFLRIINGAAVWSTVPNAEDNTF